MHSCQMCNVCVGITALAVPFFTLSLSSSLGTWFFGGVNGLWIEEGVDVDRHLHLLLLTPLTCCWWRCCWGGSIWWRRTRLSFRRPVSFWWRWQLFLYLSILSRLKGWQKAQRIWIIHWNHHRSKAKVQLRLHEIWQQILQMKLWISKTKNG